MKILIISDTHGHLDYLPKALKVCGSYPDLLIHLGDVCGDEQEIRSTVQCGTIIIPGNNDWFSSDPREIVTKIGAHTVFMVHGDRYGVGYGTDRLKYRAEELGADIALYGHTHCAEIDDSDKVLTMNPGSLSRPRSKGPSCIVVDVDENGEWKPEIKYL